MASSLTSAAIPAMRAADLLLGQLGGAHPRPDLPRRHHRPPLEIVPSLRSGRLAGHQQPDAESRTGLGADHSDHRSRKIARRTSTSPAGNFWSRATASIAGCAICVRSDGAVGIQMDKTALEPRIGIAWKPFGSQNTAIRAGYAIFHDSSWNQGAQGLWENPPYFAETDNFTGAVCPFGNATRQLPGLRPHAALPPDHYSPPNPATFPGTIQSQNLDSSKGMVQQFNLNVEHQLPGNVVLTAGYAGSRSTHILVDRLEPEHHLADSLLRRQRSVPGYTLGCGYSDSRFARSAVRLSQQQRRWPCPLRFACKSRRKPRARVTVSMPCRIHLVPHLRLRVSGRPRNLPRRNLLALARARESRLGAFAAQLNNQFTASVIYDLPFGKGKQFGSNWNGATNAVLGNWQVNVIEKVTSGFPLFMIDSNNIGCELPSGMAERLQPPRPGRRSEQGRAGGGQSGCMPHKVHTLQHGSTLGLRRRAPAGELGNAPRAPVYGPRFVNTDFSAIKNFLLPFREGMSLHFRAEFFNLFNHPQFFLTGGVQRHAGHQCSPTVSGR